MLDARRLTSVAALAALVVVLDVTVLNLIGIRTTTDAILQFVTITVGAYVGVTAVDVALVREAEAAREEE